MGALKKAGGLELNHQKWEPWEFLGNFGMFWELTWDFYKIQVGNAVTCKLLTAAECRTVEVDSEIGTGNFKGKVGSKVAINSHDNLLE